jgi:hypothetical protein
MNARYKILQPTLLAILILSLCILSIYPVAAQTDQAASKLQLAQTRVDQAFVAVLDAEKAGANITDLLVQLNIAQNILAQAENSNRIGEFNATVNYADTVIPLAQQVTGAAQNAKQTALVSSQNALLATIALTIIGTIIFILILLLVWRKFKQYYIKNLSEAKPEVTYP